MHRREDKKEVSCCRASTSNDLKDWGLFIVCFLTLYVSAGLLFWLFITLQDLTKEDDGILWVWFVLELTFAAILAYAIRSAGAKKE